MKTRRSITFGAPVEAVNAAKQRRLSKIALDYMMRQGLAGHCARFDVVSILLDGKGTVERIELLKNAFDSTD